MLKQSKYWTLPISPTESMYLVASLNYCNVNLFQILSCILNINVIHNTLNKLCVAINSSRLQSTVCFNLVSKPLNRNVFFFHFPTFPPLLLLFYFSNAHNFLFIKLINKNQHYGKPNSFQTLEIKIFTDLLMAPTHVPLL